jgi:hypothetical protein
MHLHEYFDRVYIDHYKVLPEVALEAGATAYVLGHSGRPLRWFEGEPKVCVPRVMFEVPAELTSKTAELWEAMAAKLDEAAGKLLLFAAQDGRPLRSGTVYSMTEQARDRLSCPAAVCFERDGYLIAFDPNLTDTRSMSIFGEFSVEPDRAYMRAGFTLLHGRGLATGRIS